MQIIECTICREYYNADDCDFRQTAADDYIYKCPEGHDLTEDDIEEDMILDELNTLRSMINKRDKIIKKQEREIKTLKKR